MNDSIKNNIEQYKNIAIQHGKALLNNPNDNAIDKYIEMEAKLYKLLYKQGDEGKQAIADLMGHENPQVRFLAATDSLSYSEERAVKTLMELKNTQKNLIGYNAKTMLREWKRQKKTTYQWHRFVEPNPDNMVRFGPEKLYSIFNSVRVTKENHIKIALYYSTQENGKTISKKLRGKSYMYQYIFGVKIWLKAIINNL